jgi:hypothetical protein
MNRSEWAVFLRSWQDEVLLLISLIPDYVLDKQAKMELFSSRPMKEPAAHYAVSTTELKLDCELPLELAEFFLASNGWFQYGFDEHDLEVLAIRDINYLSASDKALREGVSAYAESVGSGADRNFFHARDMDRVALISDHKSGCYLVSLAGPFAGECAVVRWHAAPKLFSSFSNLMMSERHRCLNGLRSLLD